MKTTKLNRYILLFLYLTLTVSLSAVGYTPSTVPNPHTLDIHQFVSNPDGILDAQTVAQINVALDSLERNTTAEVVVVALNSIGSSEPQPFATKLFETWGIGKKEKDNGFLILFVLDQRKVTFETGYGLEGVLTDAVGRRIREQVMIPYFKKGDYNKGIAAGVDAVAQYVRKETYDVPNPIKAQDSKTLFIVAITLYLLTLIISIWWIFSQIRKVKRNNVLKNNIERYISIRNYSNNMTFVIAIFIPIMLGIFLVIFNSWGGLLFLIPFPFLSLPAKGIGRIAMRRARQAPIVCEKCGGKMHLLSEKNEDEFLSHTQQLEEKLGSVDYDIFLCETCNNTQQFALSQPSSYSPCPKCGALAYGHFRTQTMIAATSFNNGMSRTTNKCRNCGFEDHTNTTIPRIHNNGGGVFLGGGGFGGGRSGGFSGGSFGGGRSGGGGGTSGW